ncbi:hypothetical protein N9Z65_00465 [bacterium]|nr:hypothetical protein [bacterium]
MMTLFSEGVETTSTNSVHNTLYVEAFEEAFFGVYEFEINGNTVIAEQVQTLDSSPVVRVPVVDVDGNKTEFDFILKEGKQKVELGINGNVIETQPVVVEEVAAPSLVIEDIDSNIEREYTAVTNYNTIWVESFEEIYFDVYEFELNGSKVLAEKIDVLGDHPVVKVPIKEARGNKVEANFLLKVGKAPTVETFTEAVIEQKQEEPVMVEGLNTLFVDTYDETFFGVYEFEINGNKVIAEKIGDIGNYPLVRIPVMESNGKQAEAEFILRIGNKDSVLNESKVVLTEESMSVIKEEDLRAKLLAESKTIIQDLNAKDINISYRIDKEEIIDEIKTDSRAALEKLQEETSTIVDDVERIRDSIFIEFASNSDNYRVKESAKLKQFVEGKLEELYKTNEVLAEKVKDDTYSSLESTYGSFIKKLRESQQELKERKKEHQKISNNINVLEKSHIELRDDVNVNKREILEATQQSERSVNKALSRLGTVKKELTDSKAEFDTIKDALAHSITLAEDRVKEYYHDKIEQVEKTVFDNIRRDEILKIVKESKAKILTELNDTSDIKQQLNKIVTENYDPISGKEFHAELKKGIDDKFASEMVNIRRMMELYAGGGTNAVQFADGGIMNGDLNVTTNILSGGINLLDIFAEGDNGLSGSGTAGTIAIWNDTNTIGNSIITESGGEVAFAGNISGESARFTTISALTAEFTQTIVSTTSALSVINNGTGPAVFVKQEGDEPIAHFIDADGDDIVFADNGYVGIGTFTPDEKLTVSGNISANGGLTARGDSNYFEGNIGIGTTTPNENLTVVGNISSSGTVYSDNITTLTDNVSALYAYLIQNFDKNQITTATDISDFVTNYPKTGIGTGDVITLSATNAAYILGNNDGSAITDWYEVNLKPNFLFYKQGLSDYGVLDIMPLSGAKSTKYIIEVEDKSDGALFYGEVNVISDGTIAVATEYGLNHTTIFPFVEFGAEIISGTHIQLSAMALESKSMPNFVFKGNRSNLFG